MEFGDQINRQTSPRPNRHECPRYLDQYRFICHTPNAFNQTKSSD